MANRKILIVDDENFFVEPVRMILNSAGFDVLVANDGMSGLKKARKENPDLIILDLMLPGMNGFQVCRLLKFDERFRNTPVVIVSAKDTEQDKELGRKSGANRYLTKPLDLQTLVTEIETLLV